MRDVRNIGWNRLDYFSGQDGFHRLGLEEGKGEGRGKDNVDEEK